MMDPSKRGRGYMMKVLVSACLLGENCKYNGGNNLSPTLCEALRNCGAEVTAFCAECAGGLPTPRVPAERVGNRVLNKQGDDVTAAFERGAALALKAAQDHGCKAAILKKNSPSCGSGTIYDGTFTGTLTQGDGVTAQLLKEHGITVYHEDNFEELLK